MKKRYLFLLITFLVVIASCSKDKIINTHDRVGISKVTYYPIITLIGDAIIPIANGDTYTEPGAKAEAGGAEVPVTTTGSVDTNTDGIYHITYSGTNSDGFSASASRTVVVYTTDGSASGHDLSGTYVRGATGESCIWAKIAPGVYSVTNPGGASIGRNLVVVLINPTGYSITVPDQIANDGSESGTSNETYNYNAVPVTYSWNFSNPLYGTQLRTFVKQ